MKFSAGEHMAWLQHALCLVTTNRHAHAIAVLKETVPILPNSVPACLVAARTCYENLNQVIILSHSASKEHCRPISHSHVTTKNRIYIVQGVVYKLRNAIGRFFVPPPS